MSTIITTPEHAIEHGRETGEDDGAVLYNENRDDYRSESDAVSGLGEHASEAARVLEIPREHYALWVDAYETAARETILRLYRSDNG